MFRGVKGGTFNLDPTSLHKQIGRAEAEDKLDPKAVTPADLSGQTADYDEILPICCELELLMMKDTTRGFNGVNNDRKACSLGDASATNFFPAKALGCYGDGGAIFTNDKELHDLFISIRVHGKGDFKYDNVRIGLNARLDTVQAVTLLLKLHTPDQENETCGKAAALYNSLLEDKFDVPATPGKLESSFEYYIPKAKFSGERDRLMKGPEGKGILTTVHYPKPLYLQEAYKDLGYKEGDFPVSESLSKRVFSLPVHSHITPRIVTYVAEALNDLAK